MNVGDILSLEHILNNPTLDPSFLVRIHRDNVVVEGVMQRSHLSVEQVLSLSEFGSTQWTFCGRDQELIDVFRMTNGLATKSGAVTFDYAFRFMEMEPYLTPFGDLHLYVTPNGLYRHHGGESLNAIKQTLTALVSSYTGCSNGTYFGKRNTICDKFEKGLSNTINPYIGLALQSLTEMNAMSMQYAKNVSELLKILYVIEDIDFEFRPDNNDILASHQFDTLIGSTNKTKAEVSELLGQALSALARCPLLHEKLDVVRERIEVSIDLLK